MKKLNKKGFTIVELVIVIAVIGILAAVLIPTFSNVIESAKESAALQEAKNELNAYNSFMASQGVVLGSGTVLQVGEKDEPAASTWFIYYNNTLQKIEYSDLLDTPDIWTALPTISIEKSDVRCDKYIVLDEDYKLTGDLVKKDAEGNPTDEEGYIYLFANIDAANEVKFTDGSNNCTIYGGTVVVSYEALSDSTNLTDGLFAKKSNLK